jgi:hypothetical protein
LAYGPGLHGGFLFDDYANLPTLGAFGPVDNWPTFWRYITSSTADPTGRPIALLSFLFDAHDWPAAAFPFKRTNLLLHLFNSTLLALLLHRLGQAWIGRIRVDEATRASLRQRSAWAAVLGSALWLLHPLFVSTTLYIVQREAMLPLTFVLLGLLAWLRGRARLQCGSWLTGTLWCLAGLGGGTLLAVLSKANGVLLPLLALLLESVLLTPWRIKDEATPGVRRAAHFYRAIQLLALWLPTLSIVAWLLYQGLPDILSGNTHGRPWTTGQRLLTQPRVLIDYLRELWLPHPYTSGLFNDQIAVSRSPLAPPATLWSILAVFAMLGGAWLARRRWPPLSLAILFYFGGQLIESTVLSLELYFEHRNYLPAVLLFWPLALWICGVPQHAIAKVTVPAIRIAPRATIAVALLVALAAMTYARADLWGNTREQALVWAKLNPDSPRAQANAAQLQMAAGHPELAASSLRTALASAPSEVQLALNLFGAECQMGAATPATFAAARHALGTTRDPGTLLTHWFERAIANAREPACPQADALHLASLLDAISSNRILMDKPGRRQDLAYLQGRLALAQGDGASALTDFNRALDQQLRIEAALEQAALLGAAGYPELGLEHLSHYDAKVTSGEEYPPPAGMPRLHAWILHRQGYWQKELDRLRATLREDVRNKQGRST